MNLGMALAMGGHEAEALAPLERALALEPGAGAGASVPRLQLSGARAAREGHRAPEAGGGGAAGRRREPPDARGRPTPRPAGQRDAVTELRKVTELAPQAPGGWYALGHAYNAVDAGRAGTFDDQPDDSPVAAAARRRCAAGRRPADRCLRRSIGRRSSGCRRWSAFTIRSRASTSRPATPTGRRASGRSGRLPAAGCAKRKALCEFRAGRYRPALAAALAGTDLESRYWRARAATELALAAFKRLDALPDSRERREVRATLARAERRYADAIAELKAALAFAPGDPALLDDLGTTLLSGARLRAGGRDAVAAPQGQPRRPAAARRSTATRCCSCSASTRRCPSCSAPSSATRPTRRRGLRSAARYLQKGDFAAAIPLIEPQLAGDSDGSLHVQLARAYTGLARRTRPRRCSRGRRSFSGRPRSAARRRAADDHAAEIAVSCQLSRARRLAPQLELQAGSCS